MTESHPKLLALKKIRDLELNKLSELEDKYDKISTSATVLMNDENPEDVLNQRKLLQMMAELALLKQQSSKCIPPNELLLFSSAQKLLSTEIQNLQILKNNLQTKKKSLLMTQKKLNTHVEQEVKLLKSVKQKCVSHGINIENSNDTNLHEESEHSSVVCNPIKKLKAKILCLKELSELRNSQALSFLNTYFPAPTEEQLNDASHNDIFMETVTDSVKPLERIINSLVVKHLNCFKNPWIRIDPTFWIPHVEFLIRCGIAVRNEENPSLIRLEHFEL